MKKRITAATVFLLCTNLFAQTNPTAQGLPYTQNFGTTTFTVMPTGCVAWTVNSSPSGSQTNAQNSTPNGNAGISAATTVQSTGGCYGYASSSNGRFYVQTSSNATNGTSQMVCAVNTSGWSNIKISYDVEMISANPRTIGVILQYRIGTTGAWANVTGGVYAHNNSDRANGTNDNFIDLALPQAAENNAVVQLRWAMWRGSETGNSSGIGIDNISVTGSSSQTAGYFRSKQNGNWNDVNTWEASTDNNTWSTATASPDYTANTITIQSGNTVTLTATDTIDQVLVEGTLIYADVNGSTPRINNGAGCDLTVNGTFEDLSSTSIAWANGAIWSMGSNGTIIRTRSTSANNWRDKYDEGIAAIPATATWILRKTGTDNPTLSSTGNMVYPNLIIENNTGTTWGTASTPGFTGTSSAPVIKGSLDIGGNGTGNVSFVNDNTFTTPVLVIGDLTIKAGSTLRSYGTGFTVQGNLTVNGTIDYGTSNSQFVFSGNNTQTIAGTGTISFLNVQLNKTSTAATVTLQSPATVSGMFTFTSGHLITTTANLLTFTNTASAIGANNTSFVEGPAKKIGNAAFVFPTGKSNNYQPISISAPTNSAAAYTAEYFHADAALGIAKDTTIDSVSTCEYWTLNNVGTVYPVNVSLGWNSQSCAIAPGIGNMRLTKWDGSKWVDLGNSAGVIGTVSTLETISGFGAFTLAQRKTPKLDFSTVTDSVDVGSSITFTNTSSGFLSSTEFAWNFGDFCYDSNISGIEPLLGHICIDTTDGSGQLINHIYYEAGTYSILLSATDLLGNNYSFSKTIFVKSPMLSACNSGTNCDLVCNGGFENHSCFGYPAPDFHNHLLGFTKVDYWSNLYYTGGGGAVASPDYLDTHSCTNPNGTVSVSQYVPDNNIGCQDGHNNSNAYIGIYTYAPSHSNYREYATSQLNMTMQIGQSYNITYYVSLAEASKYATSPPSAYFTSVAPLQPLTGSSNTIVSPVPVNHLAHPINYGYNLTISDKINWTQITMTYLAQGGEKFVTLGNFNDDVSTLKTSFGLSTIICPYINSGAEYLNLQQNPGDANGAYYYIDDISIIPVNGITVTATPASICYGQSSTLTAAGGNGTYTWTSSPAGVYSNTPSISVSPTTTTTYTVTSITVFGCQQSQSITITVNPIPTVTLISNSPICSGDQVQLTAAGTSSYSWTLGVTPTSVNTATASTGAAGFDPPYTVSYTVTGTDGTCSNTATTMVTINPIPATIIATPNPICAGESATLTASGATTYQWLTTNGETTSAISVTPTINNNTYIVVGTNTYGCSNSASATVEFWPTPVITGNQAPCTGTTTTYTINYYYGSLSQVSILPASAGNIVSSSVNTIEVTWNAPGSIIISNCPNDQVGFAVTPINCCSGNQVTDFSGIYSGGAFDLISNVTLAGGTTTTLVGLTLDISPAVSITVDNGAMLTLDNCHLYACNGMWQGIIVMPGGTLIVSSTLGNGTLIEDAINAIFTPATAGTDIPHLNIDGAIFNKNETAININDNANDMSSNTIKNAVFTCRTFPLPGGQPFVPPIWGAFATIKNDFANNSLIFYPTTVTNAGVRSQTGVRFTNIRQAPLDPIYYVKVGDVSSPNDVTIFDNLDYGLYLTASTCNIKNNHFQNMTGNQPVCFGCQNNPTGVGVFAPTQTQIGNTVVNIGGDPLAANSGNSFIDCFRGVEISNYEIVKADNNNFNCTTTPLFTLTNPTIASSAIFLKNISRTINIKNSTFNNWAYPVWVNRNITGSTHLTPSINIINNIIGANTSGYCAQAVYLTDVTNNFNGVTRIKDNNFYDVDNGIRISNIKNDMAIYNNPSMALRYNPSGMHAGVWLDGCDNAEVKNNTILTPFTNYGSGTGNWDVRGIYANNSTNNRIFCNTISNFGQCLVFEGNCASSTNAQYEDANGILGNEMNNARTGLMLRNNGVIGQQGAASFPSSNHWNGTYSDGATYVLNSPNVDVNSPLWYLYSGTSIPGPNIASPIFMAYTSAGLNATTGSEVTCPSIYVPAMVTAPNNGYKALNTIDTAYIYELKQLLNNSIINPGIFSASNYLMQTFVYNEVKGHSALQEDSTLNYFYIANQNNSIGLIRSVNDSIQTGNFIQAIVNNNNIITANSIEENQKVFNTIYLKKLDTVALYTSSDSSILYSIAAQCAGEGGNAVYQSRNLLMFLVNRVINFVDNCDIPNVPSYRRAITKEVAKAIRLYPNPNNGSMTLEYNIEQDGELQIWDITGKLVGIYKLNSHTNTMKINDNLLINGVYYYSITVNKKKLLTDKLVIIK